ncbi:LacI family DNA-binding transcriptional regulator [Labrys wisconsinensis]|uniref:LacI family transcriptional regulator n=1 Tax=Labrys wisconsinensis TaxID=425677 RepID=A0ABU0J0H5_9HYPH|nr:LacI family DNA-binding transcriptional regulator [Labrys wisconsinensis]MDQ0467770.1 LacI family transcriptional regulator [Labrys wisconsinensis]
MATIVEVARLAGVSVSTVSHVVNRTRYVAPATARLVTEAIADIGYQPNTIARSLKTASTSSVGLAISAISNPYFSDIICAVEAECARLGLMVFLSDTQDDPDTELAVVQALHRRRVDGVILAPSAAPQRTLDHLHASRVPCVLIDRLPDARFDQVGVDNAGAMRLLVDHAVAFGHRRIGFVAGHPGFATTLERIEGFRAALAAHGLAFDPATVATGSATTAAAAAAAHALLSLPSPPSLIVTGNNLATIGAMRAIRERGLAVPADLSLVGLDDFEWADCFEPRLTLVAQPCEEIGRQAAALLVERIARPDGPRQTVRLPPALRPRASCGSPA